MAFAKGKETAEIINKKYVGVASVFVKAVNPSKKTLEKIYNTEIENNPEYLAETEVKDKSGNTVKIAQARITFVLQTDPAKCGGVNTITRATFYLNNRARYNGNFDKVQVIDKYGRTAWVTVEQAKNHEIPVYKNGKPANIDKDYRACYDGEELLTNFIKAYLGIPNVMRYVNGEWVMVSNPEDCEARLEKIDKYFKEDFSELDSIIKLQPNNKLKVLFGVRTTDESKQYQSVYTQMVLKNGVSDYSRLEKDVMERKNAGAFSTTEFTNGGKTTISDLTEYKVEATDFSTPESSDMPFGSDDESPWNL